MGYGLRAAAFGSELVEQITEKFQSQISGLDGRRVKWTSGQR